MSLYFRLGLMLHSHIFFKTSTNMELFPLEFIYVNERKGIVLTNELDNMTKFYNSIWKFNVMNYSTFK